jgi:predicted TIM-barrel fold metal-dependent hydrolase
MSDRVAIISVDGHVTATRSGYRDYIEHQYLDAFDDWVRAEEHAERPEVGNVHPAFDRMVQCDSDLRLAALDGQGVVAEVLFPNGMPFQTRRFEDAGFNSSADINRQARLAYNRWVVDFCALAPARRAGQVMITFDDIPQAVADIHWAKENGLRGVLMPGLDPGGIFFFDPALDPVWAACQEVGLPISQHGGAGAPAYDPPGFAAIMTLAVEQSFFCGRSLWQMMLGGVFERFPNLQVAWVETGPGWIPPIIAQLDRRFAQADSWVGFAVFMERAPQFTRTASEYWESNCHVGVSPFGPTQIDYAALNSAGAPNDGAFRIGSHKTMFGVDFPHFESIAPATLTVAADLVGHLSDADAHNVLFANAAKLYGFNLAELEPHIDRVGFHLDDLRTGQVGAAPTT